MQWMVDNWDAIMSILAGIHMIALALINLTKTKKAPDGETSTAYKVLEFAAGIVTKKAKQ